MFFWQDEISSKISSPKSHLNLIWVKISSKRKKHYKTSLLPPPILPSTALPITMECPRVGGGRGLHGRVVQLYFSPGQTTQSIFTQSIFTSDPHACAECLSQSACAGGTASEACPGLLGCPG